MMIQDIAPLHLDNQYKDKKADKGSFVLSFRNDEILCHSNTNSFPHYEELNDPDTIYLFSIDNDEYYLTLDPVEISDGEYVSIRTFLSDEVISKEKAYAAFTAYHLDKWYKDNRYCGRCGKGLVHDHKERALRCPDCGNIIYPRINPAVIIGVINKDKIILTRYAHGYRHNALIAGFTEIGETLEECVKREVMEEVGLNVKNIRYYKSQPWGIAQDILMGFYCEVDGDDTIKVDENELKSAIWTKREDIELQPVEYSLTNEMMKMFKEGRQ